MIAWYWVVLLVALVAVVSYRRGRRAGRLASAVRQMMDDHGEAKRRIAAAEYAAMQVEASREN